MTTQRAARVTLTVYAALIFCLLGTLIGYLAFHLLVGVETECAGSAVTCGNTDVATRWTVIGGAVGLALGVTASLTSTAKKVAAALLRSTSV